MWKWFISDSWIILVWEHVENHHLGKLKRNPKPELEDFLGDSLAKPPFRVTSNEAVVISPATVFFRVPGFAIHGPENLRGKLPKFRWLKDCNQSFNLLGNGIPFLTLNQGECMSMDYTPSTLDSLPVWSVHFSFGCGGAWWQGFWRHGPWA